MLGQNTVYATIAVKDINTAKQFYSDTLGLTQSDANEAGVTYTSGSGKLFVYQSPTAGTNQATCASWDVSDIETLVKDLQGKGVTFEEYDMPGGTRDGAIHSMGPWKSAWFKDPDGNILAVGSM